MTWSQFQDVVKVKLTSASNDTRHQFAVNVCKRLFPDYLKFSEVNDWGDADLLLQGIDFCEGNKIFHDGLRVELNLIKTRIDEVTPDTEDFGNLDGSYALNASSAVFYLLQYLEEDDVKYLVYISHCATDTADFKDLEDYELGNKEFGDDSHMQEEILKQIHILDSKI